MPCHDHYPTRAEDTANEDLLALKARLDHVTDLLCHAGHAYITGHPIPPSVQDWWAQHRKDDKAANTPKPPRKFKVS